MLVVGRGIKMKLKIALAISITSLIALFVWYYVDTGENPMTEIKNKLRSVVVKYYDTDNDENILDEKSKESPSDEDFNHEALKEKPSDLETGLVGTLTTQPDVQMMNELRSKDTISYNEGELEGAMMTFYREAKPKNGPSKKSTVLFLHGDGFNSAIWINIGTFQILADFGYRAVAVDLPGQGNSNDVKIPYSQDDILSYMRKLLFILQPKMPVLVAPSKSGKYAMPVLMKYPHLLSGFVAISPSATSDYFITDYKKLTVPLLVMFGEYDDSMLKASSLDNFFYVPDRKIYMIRNTTHSCYVDHPPTFHKLLLQFLDGIKQ